MATSILLLTVSLAIQALAQNANLTVSFSPATLDNCASNGSTEAIIFTTSSIPLSYQCFNIEDLFGSSNASPSWGSRTTESASRTYTSEEISRRVFNANSYSAQTNYSRIWYQQQNFTSPKQGEDAARIFECLAAETTCQSSGNGECYEAPYNIGSFQIGSAAAVNSGAKKCWVASTGSAAERFSGSKTAAAVGAAAILAAGMLSW
ncbi:hypothetical protein KCU81_g8148, partial [Aureobasidium melanogenum]|uniref:Uncharacterized protein n=1 Tax=Aureobasidium melanogenum (strain CBS 110374) TaxID=1043003 RepID=A0A074VKZ1_AURM1